MKIWPDRSNPSPCTQSRKDSSALSYPWWYQRSSTCWTFSLGNWEFMTHCLLQKIHPLASVVRSCFHCWQQVSCCWASCFGLRTCRAENSFRSWYLSCGWGNWPPGGKNCSRVTYAPSIGRRTLLFRIFLDSCRKADRFQRGIFWFSSVQMTCFATWKSRLLIRFGPSVWLCWTAVVLGWISWTGWCFKEWARWWECWRW